MTCKAVFGLILYGVPNAAFPTQVNPCLYTNGALPTAGRPAELATATILPLVTGLPGVNWGANPRQPTGDAGSCTVTLCDDFDGSLPHMPKGALGKLFLVDRAAAEWGLESNRITDATSSIVMVNAATPPEGDPLFLGNECVSIEVTAGPTIGWSRTCSLTRALCGSTARVHTFKPSDMSEGEDGSQDRLFLKSKPDWSEGFLCGVYEFILDELGAIKDYMLRRGVVTGEPTPIAGHQYQVNIKFIEDRINSHKIGELSKETTLSRLILVHKLEGTSVDAQLPQEVSILLQLHEAEAFFNEALSPRGGTKINQPMLSDLNARLFGDSDVTYQVKVKNDAEWVYDLTALGYYTWVSDGQFYEAVKLSCVLTEGGFVPDTTCIVRAEGTNDYNLSFKPWYNNNLLSGANAQGGSNVIVSGTSTQGPPPVITLRLRIQKTLVQTFLTLAISYDGSSGDTYDKLIGGLGAGLPESYFSLGSVSATPLTILGNTVEMLQLDQLLNPVNEYYFDLSKGISLKDWLSNECIGAQLLLGSRKNGLVGLRSWVHEVASSVTLEALNKEVVPADSERGGISALRKLDLFYGTNVLSLEPLYHRSIRFLGPVREDETQPLRIWRQGIQLGPGGVANFIDIFGLLRAFYQVFGRKPKCYPVEIALEDFILQGIQFGDAVRWVDADVVTCNGLGFDADCFVVSIDCDYQAGKVTLLLIENTLFTSPTPTVEGNISPSLKILSVSNVNATTVDVEVDRIDGFTFDPILDFGGLYDSIQGHAGYLWINNYYQAPIGDLEKIGDLEAYCILDTITPGSPNVFRLVVDSDWIRGANVAVVDDLFVVGETRLNLPPRVPAIANLENNLIEPDSVALPEDQNFVTFMPRRPLYGTTHAFGS